MIRAPSQPHSPSTELTLIVEFAEDADDALLRVLSTLHRRRCRVTAAEFDADHAAPGRLALRILAPAAYAGRVACWLNSLVDVRRVAAIGGADAASRPRTRSEGTVGLR